MFRLAVITVFASAIAFAQPLGRSSNKSLTQSTPTRDLVRLHPPPYAAFGPTLRPAPLAVAPLSPGFTIPLCTGFPNSHSPALVVNGSSIHILMPAKPVKR